MALDIAMAADRMAPGLAGSSPAKITFANGANAEVPLRAHPGQTGAALPALYFAFKTTAGCTIATGPQGLAAPTTNDPRFDASDGWQDMILRPGDTHIRIFGDGTGGTAYVWFNGR